MDKTLDTVVLVHRLIIVVVLALLTVGLSVHGPNPAYDEAKGEVERLQDGIRTVSDQVEKAYGAIYNKSELKASTLAWLKQHNSAQPDIKIKIVTPGDFAIPNSTENSLVTLEAQVRWANRVYRDLDSPFFLCAVDHGQVFQALDKLFYAPAIPAFTQVIVYIRGPVGPDTSKQFRCEIGLQYGVEIGTLTGLRTVMLDIPTTVVAVTQVEPPGPNWVDLEIVGTLKANGLGDYEDEPGMAIFRLRELWADLGGRSPDAALALLNQKKEDEAEKAKQKVEILGASFSGSLTITLATVAELCLMVYLLAHLLQVHAILPGHEAAISESPFFGIMQSGLGRLVILATLFIMPLGVSMFAFVSVFPAFKTEWLSLRWFAGMALQCALITAVGATGLLLVRQAYSTMAVLRRAGRNTPKVGAGLEDLG
jgi:hypothetical protein